MLQGGTSTIATIFLIVNAALGAGLLNFPKAFDQAGGVLVAVLVQVVSWTIYFSTVGLCCFRFGLLWTTNCHHLKLFCSRPVCSSSSWSRSTFWPPLATSNSQPLFKRWIREGSGYQNGLMFGKVPNGLWQPLPLFSENYIPVLGVKLTPPLLELFQKFIRFGTLTRP